MVIGIPSEKSEDPKKTAPKKNPHAPQKIGTMALDDFAEALGSQIIKCFGRVLRGVVL